MRPTRGCRRHGQGLKRERRIAILEFLLKYKQQTGRGQAPEPPAVGRNQVISQRNYFVKDINSRGELYV
jgi:hypothetical protein